MNAVPHDSWAGVYDQVYQRTFGDLYTHLTSTTLEVIAGLCPEKARIIDFGAGTGRLAIPLAHAGHDVVAVDLCAAMLEELRKKAEGNAIETVCCRMSEFDSTEPADLALGVFTVLLYILDEKELLKSFTAARRSLKAGGRMLVDVASPALFQGFKWSDEQLARRVAIHPLGAERFLYQEYVELRNPDGDLSRYEDSFTIRRWTTDEVLEAARASDFALERDLSDDFAGSGSWYFLLQTA